MALLGKKRDANGKNDLVGVGKFAGSDPGLYRGRCVRTGDPPLPLTKGLRKAEEMHRTAVGYVKATFQSRFYRELAETLPEAELAVLKRGRNAKSGHQPNSSGVAEYHNATGVEAVFGALWLTGETERLEALFQQLYAFIEREGETKNE